MWFVKLMTQGNTTREMSGVVEWRKRQSQAFPSYSGIFSNWSVCSKDCWRVLKPNFQPPCVLFTVFQKHMNHPEWEKKRLHQSCGLPKLLSSMEKQDLGKQDYFCDCSSLCTPSWNRMCFWFWYQLHSDFGDAMIRAMKRLFQFHSCT